MTLQLVFSIFFLLLVIASNLYESLNLKNASVFNSRFKTSEIFSWQHKAREETKLKILKGLGLSAPPAISHRQKLIYRQKSMRYRRGLNRKTKSELKIYPAWVGKLECFVYSHFRYNSVDLGNLFKKKNTFLNLVGPFCT